MLSQPFYINRAGLWSCSLPVDPRTDLLASNPKSLVVQLILHSLCPSLRFVQSFSLLNSKVISCGYSTCNRRLPFVSSSVPYSTVLLYLQKPIKSTFLASFLGSFSGTLLPFFWSSICGMQDIFLSLDISCIIGQYAG